MKWQNVSPQWFYPRLIPHVIKLCIKYKEPISVITRANPLFPFGGLPFAPKNEMFKHFNNILPFILLSMTSTEEEKIKSAKQFIKSYPIILKPNITNR